MLKPGEFIGEVDAFGHLAADDSCQQRACSPAFPATIAVAVAAVGGLARWHRLLRFRLRTLLRVCGGIAHLFIVIELIESRRSRRSEFVVALFNVVVVVLAANAARIRVKDAFHASGSERRKTER